MELTPEKQQVVARLVPLLVDQLNSELRSFVKDHPGEHIYALTLLAPASGRNICAAIATEEGLAKTVRSYSEAGYFIKSGEQDGLEKVLRWATPDDGWHYLFFAETAEILVELNQAYQREVLELYDMVTDEICLRALRQLDRLDLFGEQPGDETIVFGFSYGSDPQHFFSTAPKVNPEAIIERVQPSFEMADRLIDELVCEMDETDGSDDGYDDDDDDEDDYDNEDDD